MKLIQPKAESAISYGGLIEKIEILRSTLRWASKLERPQIQKLLGQCNALRDEVMQLSRKERFVTATAAGQRTRKQTEAQRRKALMDRSFVFEGVFGESPKLLDALEISEKAAPTDLPVLIDGESGTGKELMAKVIHANGSRADKPYISVNCGAIPENLLESELFGHKRGAFTGASSDRSGKFEAANNGTIFLDEIGELPLQGQVKLLRVLQSNEIQRVGSDQVIDVDARIVAATNKDLLQMCREGSFREDLYYRLGVIQVTLPPLRERKDEIPLLIDYFGDEAAEKLQRAPVKLSRRLRTFLMSYAYPGNIRELRNIIFRIACLAGDTADFEHLPENIRPNVKEAKQEEGEGEPQTMSLADVKKTASDAAERRFLERGLQESGGKVSELARQLNMNRSHLQTLLKKHGLRSKEYRARS
ncbi:MAG: sigma 54-interacting transcriptional regulator [Gammaproteobacteria bacterium]|jgi:transcriptional regulator with GAF, ATPase, and Fis domain